MWKKNLLGALLLCSLGQAVAQQDGAPMPQYDSVLASTCFHIGPKPGSALSTLHQVASTAAATAIASAAASKRLRAGGRRPRRG